MLSMPAAMLSMPAAMHSVPANVDCLQEEEYIVSGTSLGVVICVVIVMTEEQEERGQEIILNIGGIKLIHTVPCS